MEDVLLTPEQVARRLQVKERTVYDWLRIGRLQGLKLGRLWRIRPEDLDIFLGVGEVAEHEPLLSVEQAARYLSHPATRTVTPGEVVDYIKTSRLRARRAAGEWRIRQEDLDDFLTPEEEQNAESGWQEYLRGEARSLDDLIRESDR